MAISEAARAARSKNLKDWHDTIDRTRTFTYYGRNGIHYEYLIPKAADYSQSPHLIADAIISRKGHNNRPSRAKKWVSRGIKKVYRTGEAQPLGDHSKFTLYQIKAQKKAEKQKQAAQQTKEEIEVRLPDEL